MKTYRIVRYYEKDKDSQVIARGLSLAAAQAHCRDLQTQKIGNDGRVEWFDGYEEDR